jgi:DNA (cytosine-5)-methyltransferase 1
VTHLSLFTGIGGLDLAAEWAGFETVLQVEMDEYATKILEKHWPNVPRTKDVREVTSESVDRPITVISGGFPCQPHSISGKRQRDRDDRFLWPEMLRVIREIKPTWIVAENVPGTISDGTADEVLHDLEITGYSAIPILSEAYAYGASFRGERVFYVAAANSEHGKEGMGIFQNGKSKISKGFNKESFESLRIQAASRGSRSGNGIPDYLHRVKSLGNAVVPQQAYPIFKAIAEVERDDTAIF